MQVEIGRKPVQRPTSTTSNQLRAVIAAVVETINECPQGAPLGPLYAAVMGHLSYEQFTTLISSLVSSGCFHQNGHVIHAMKPSRLITKAA